MNFRKAIFWIHLSLGLGCGLVLAVLAGTGMAMAFEPQLMAFAEAGAARLPSAVPAGVPRKDLDELVKLAGLENVTAFSLVRVRNAALRLQQGKKQVLYIDPYNGTVTGLGAGSLNSFFRWCEDLHRYFLFEGARKKAAHEVKNAANLIFLFLLLSGAVLWLREAQWRRKAGLNDRAGDLNWHSVLGVWSLPFLLMISFSGLVISYGWAEGLLYKATGTQTAPKLAKAVPVGARPAPLEAYMKASEARVPDWKSISFTRGKPNADCVRLVITHEARHAPWGRGTLVLEAATAKELLWEPHDSQNGGRKLRLWLRQLHTGQAFGLVGQVMAFLAAAAVLALIYFGFSLSYRRFFSR